MQKEEKEFLDVYDENNKPLNKSYDRNKVHDEGLWHHEILVIIINNKNQVLLQKRSYKKRHLAGKWALCAGHVVSGETEKATAVRELQEELGLKILQKDLEFIEIFKKSDPTNRKFSYIYVLRTDKKLKEIKIQSSELTRVKYVSIRRLIKLIKSKEKHLAFADEYHYELFKKILNNII